MRAFIRDQTAPVLRERESETGLKTRKKTLYIIVNARGSELFPAHNLQVEASFDPDFIAALKAKLPPDARYWDEPAKCWRVRGDYREKVTELGFEYFPGVYLCEDGRETNLRTGQATEQPLLFA